MDHTSAEKIVTVTRYANFWKNTLVVAHRAVALRMVVIAPAVMLTPMTVRASWVRSPLVLRCDSI